MSTSSENSNIKILLQTTAPNYERIHKTKLALYQSTYSLLLCLVTHPLLVIQTVSENKSIFLTKSQVHLNFLQKSFISYGNTISIKQCAEILSQDFEREIGKAIPKTRMIRNLYTAFPSSSLALILNDLLIFIPQIYYTTHYGLQPFVAGTLTASSAAIICTPLFNIYRNQVNLKMKNQPHSFLKAATAILNSSDTFNTLSVNNLIRLTKYDNNWKLTGIFPRFYRGMGVGIFTLPAAGATWATYESCKEKIQNHFQTKHVWTHFISGSIGGTVNAILNRPVANLIARKQILAETESYYKIFYQLLRNEGIASFWKGLTMRISINIFRMGFFYSAFALLTTYAME